MATRSILGILFFLIIFVMVGVVIGLLVYSSSKKKQAPAADPFWAQLSACQNAMAALTRESSVSSFFRGVAFLSQNAPALESFRGRFSPQDWNCVNALNEFQGKYASLQKDLQWLLRNAMDRQTNQALEAVQNTFRNSNEHQLWVYQSFCRELQQYDSSFSAETKDFAAACADKLLASLTQRETQARLYPLSAESTP